MSKYMTPDAARQELNQLKFTRTDIPPVTHVALTALAADRLEWRVEHQHIDGGLWHPVTPWTPEWPLHEGRAVAPDERIMCRRVSALWEVTHDQDD